MEQPEEVPADAKEISTQVPGAQVPEEQQRQRKKEIKLIKGMGRGWGAAIKGEYRSTITLGPPSISRK
ncbi:hypothetical protein [Pseudomonas sp. 460]|uniref:hypothetical protein n=1 Tax=Pseudomonas sp. 460 TaxID=2485142 RepID=UPI00104BC09E|nr:hypothetical protein [Pseudomonas sp. 460]